MKVCRKKPNAKKSNNNVNRRDNQDIHRQHHMGDDNSSNYTDNDDEIYNLFPIISKKVPPIIVELSINNRNIPMEIDTGASLTVMSERTIKQRLINRGNKVNLKPFRGMLKTYTGEVIKPCGVVDVSIVNNNQKTLLPVVVLPGSGPTLLGRNWLQALKLDWKKSKRHQRGNEKKDWRIFYTNTKTYLTTSWEQWKGPSHISY